MAFFPCTRFEDIIPLAFRGEQRQQEKWSDEKKLLNSMKLHEELHELYMLISKLVLVCLKNHLRLVIENPYSRIHYLTQYWCIKPALIDNDRTLNGDYYKKPTQYFFINDVPQNNLVFEPIDYVERQVLKRVNKSNGNIDRKVLRSMIHPQYANRFIRQYLIEQ